MLGKGVQTGSKFMLALWSFLSIRSYLGQRSHKDRILGLQHKGYSQNNTAAHSVASPHPEPICSHSTSSLKLGILKFEKQGAETLGYLV